MTMMGLIIVCAIVAWAVVAWVVVILIRNERVWSYRDKLLSAVSDAAQADIKAGREWMWRYDALDAVPYYAMVFQFWRQFDSFYPDKAFIERRPA